MTPAELMRQCDEAIAAAGADAVVRLVYPEGARPPLGFPRRRPRSHVAWRSDGSSLRCYPAAAVRAWLLVHFPTLRP